MFWKVVVLAVLCLAIAAGAVAYLIYAPVVIDGTMLVTIHRGETTGQIASAFEQAGLLKSRLVFVSLAKWRRIDRRLHPGRYEFSGPTSTVDLLDALRDGKLMTVTVTIPEGWTIARMSPYLGGELGFDSAEFAALAQDTAVLRRWSVPFSRMEGYLLPDTYEFYWGVEPGDVLKRLAAGMQDAFNDTLTARAAALGLSRHQVLTLASMIEAEAAEGDERSRIAGVFHNRLRLGMLLQCDPTVIYGMGGLPGDRLLTSADLETPSEYNTYLNPGLPPSPICNPGRAAIRAALYPDSTEELYFVANGKGGHVFSETLDKHNTARARVKRELRQK